MKKGLGQSVMQRAASPSVGGIVLGLFVGFNKEGEPLVDFPGNPTGNCIPSRFTVALTEQDRGRDVALVFESGDAARPILLGLIQPATPNPQRLLAKAGTVKTSIGPTDGKKIDAMVDGKCIEIEGQDQIVLRCGEASITLRRNGRVIIRGIYVESRSKGVNRIKGGSVLIN
jgi:hypothetical protein